MDFQEVYEDTVSSVAAAARRKNLPLLNQLLEAGRRLDGCDNRGFQPLHEAAFVGFTSGVKLLLKKGACVDAQSYEGETPLLLACRGKGTALTVRTLVKSGASINLGNKETCSPLHKAIELDKGQVARELLRLGANTETCDFNAYTPLHIAAEENRDCMVQLLISKGANVNAVDHNKRTPLFVAASLGHAKVVRVLLKQKCVKVNHRTNDGATPLMLAAQCGNMDCLSMLLEARANPNLMTKDGCLALHLAARKGNTEAVQHLLEATSSTVLRKSCSSIYSQTSPFLLAISSQSLECVKLMVKAGLKEWFYGGQVLWSIMLMVTDSLMTVDDVKKHRKKVCNCFFKVPLYTGKCAYALALDKPPCEDNVEMLTAIKETGLKLDPAFGTQPPLVAAMVHFSYVDNKTHAQRSLKWLLEEGANVDYRSKNSSFEGPDAFLAAMLYAPDTLPELFRYSSFNPEDFVAWCVAMINSHHSCDGAYPGWSVIRYRVPVSLSLVLPLGAAGSISHAVKRLHKRCSDQVSLFPTSVMELMEWHQLSTMWVYTDPRCETEGLKTLWNEVNTLCNKPPKLFELSRCAVRQSVRLYSEATGENFREALKKLPVFDIIYENLLFQSHW